MIRPRFFLGVLLGSLPTVAWETSAAAQSAAYFSPTYAASQGSPYSEVYARTFGSGGPPLETSAPPPAVPETGPASAPEATVYVIEGGRVLTYSAEDYASGGTALARSALPSAGGGAIAPEVRVPTVADRLYDTPSPAPALETAAGPQDGGSLVPLLPQRKPATPPEN